MKLLKIMILPLNIAVAIILVLSAIAQYISPAAFNYLSFLSPAFPIFVAVNILFFLWWVLCLSKYAVISLLALLIVYPDYKHAFSFSKKDTVVCEDCQKIKVLSFNTMTLDYYKKANNNKAIDFLKNVDVDILCLQEIGWKTKGDYLKKKDIINALDKYPYHYFHIAQESDYGTYGIATFSKHKIINYQNIVFANSFNSAMMLDIKIKDDTIRLLNCHLESNGLSDHDRKMLTDSTANKQILFGTIQKMRKASAIRAKEADTIAEFVRNTPYPIVVCGDFNDTAFSYTYCTISKTLTDNFCGSGIGPGFTFFDHLYRFRIDYILTSDDFEHSNFQVINEKCSDHRPISSELFLKQ